MSGIVYGSTVFAENAVIKSARAPMHAIPQDQPLVVTARVGAIHIDQAHFGQNASLRFPTFNQRITPDVASLATAMSADALPDELTGATYSWIEPLPKPQELPTPRNQAQQPGMP